MRIRGENFVKKVQLQQEREELEQKLNELEEAEQTYVKEDPIIIEESISNTHQIDDIMLDPNELPSQEDSKKKYIILGVVLVVLFLLTIVIIRLLTNDDKNDSFIEPEVNQSNSIQNKEDSNIEDNFQKIINERIKKDTKEQKTKEPDNITSESKINKIEKQKKVMEQKLDETIKKIEAKTKEIKKEEKKVRKVIKRETTKSKKSIKNLIKETTISKKNNTKIKGYFVQIGAFTKTPSASYINKIRNSNLKYKIYKVNIKGTNYNKVLIGPYSSRVIAKKEIESIKTKLNLSSAYVLSF